MVSMLNMAWGCGVATTQATVALFSKELMLVADDTLCSNITTLGPLMPPISKQVQFLAATLLRRVARGAMKVKPFVSNFKLMLEHFYIHACGRDVLDELERSLDLNA